MNRNVIEYLLFSSGSPLPDTGEPHSSLDENNDPEKQMLLNTYRHQVSNSLKEFANMMPGGFFIYRANKDKELIYVNEAVLRIFGCDTLDEFRELTGNSFRGIVHPDDFDDVQKKITDHISNSLGAVNNVNYRIIRKDNEIRWIEDYRYYSHSETADDVYYVFVSDTTEKKKQQMWEATKKQKYERLLQDMLKEYDQELQVVNQEQLERLETIEGLSVDYESIFYVDLDKNLMKAYRVSERFKSQFPDDRPICEFTGFDTDYIENWVYPDDRDIVRGISNPAFIRKKLEKEQAFHTNYRILRGGKPAYIHLRIVKVGDQKHISQVLFGYRNVDNEIEQELQQKQMLADALDVANAANKAKNLFLSNMSHDVRTPMNAIIGFTDLIRKHIHDPEKITEYLDMITHASDQLMQLLNDVLEISRLESGADHPNETRCSLIDMIGQVHTEYLPLADKKDITFSVDTFTLKHPLIYAEQQKLNIILSHIVDNAIKYTNEGGKVSFTAKEEKEPIDQHAVYKFIIEDNGIGISKDFQEQIFEPFVREKNTTMSGIHGTGLGLTIAKNLTDIMGGTIELDSEPGTGSKFTLTLPLRVQDNQTAPMTESDADEFEVDLTGKRILVVDDNEINVEIEKEVLKTGGFLVDTAPDGSIALEKIRNSAPGYYNLILMDIQMPVMDGYTATREIRKLKDPGLANIPIIAVSANTFDEDKKMSLECGMNAHLPKPVDAPDLFQMICKYLSKMEETH